jgi:hypothetical protein
MNDGLQCKNSKNRQEYSEKKTFPPASDRKQDIEPDDNKGKVAAQCNQESGRHPLYFFTKNLVHRPETWRFYFFPRLSATRDAISITCMDSS